MSYSAKKSLTPTLPNAGSKSKKSLRVFRTLCCLSCLLLQAWGVPLAHAEAGDGSIGPVQAQGYSLLTAANSPEYKWDYVLAQVKAGAAFARGIAGAGVTIGIFDTGVYSKDSEFAGRFLGEYNAATGTWSSTGTDVYGHGTFVAGLAAAAMDGNGMMGVAPDADIRSFRVLNSQGSMTISDAQLAGAINQATITNTKIASNSWNASAPAEMYLTTQKAAMAYTLSTYYGNTIAAYGNFINHGGVVVFAAGNDGSANPGIFGLLPAWFSNLQSGWLVATATDSSGQIASYANRCGAAAAYCLAAPGTSVISTMNGGGYGIGSGTSFATPVVSGGVALLMQLYPYLSGASIKNILLSTADKTGIYANQAIYGQGLMDLDKATQPIGAVVVPTSTSVQGAVVPLSKSVVVTSSLLNKSVKSVLGGAEFGVLDSYNRSYMVSGSDLITNNSALKHNFDSLDALHDFAGGVQNVALQNGDVTATMLYLSATEHLEAQDNTDRFATSFASKEGYGFGLNMGVSAAYQYGAFGEGLITPTDYVAGSLVSNPYLALAADSKAAYVQLPVAENTTLRTGTFSGVRNDGSLLNNVIVTPGENLPTVQGFASEVRMNPALADNRLTLRGLSGMVDEEQAVLGSTSSGALNFGDRTSTLFIGGGADLKLTPHLLASVDFTMGRSNVSQAAGSLINTGTLTSQAWSAQLIGSQVLTKKDRFALAVSQPLAITNGNATIQVPGARDIDGNIGYSHLNANMKATAQETDMQGFYSFQSTDHSHVSVGAVLRLQPDNDGQAKPEAIGLVRYSFSF